MNAPEAVFSAVSTPNQFIDVGGRTLAYRSIGAGKTIVLCARFRGGMDIWDPLFLDSLAASGLRVITFDYTGLGLSTGDKVFDPVSMAKDANDLLAALNIDDAIASGWSLGGMAAQIAIVQYPERFSHGVLLGTTPPQAVTKPSEQLFFDTARIPDYSFEDQLILFFEPKSEASRAAARRSIDRIALRQTGRSTPWPVEWAVQNLGASPKQPIFPAPGLLEGLQAVRKPMLHIGGDHDIVFPVENWYALNGQLPSLHLLTFPEAGHGPQHQYPEACAEYIAAFVRATS